MKTKLIISIIVISIVIVFSCKKEAETPTGGNKIEIGKSITDSLSYYSAKISTVITGLNGNEITKLGHCWSQATTPTVEKDESVSGVLDSITVSSNLIGLKANKSYYVRPFVTTNQQTLYGQEVIIQTMPTGKPIITTNEVTNITINTATCGGINDDGGLTISQRGICWNTTGNPTLENNLDFTNNGSGTGSFTSQLTGLAENTTYYVTAYAINEEGTVYGQTKSFLATNDCVDPRDGQIYETVVVGNQTWFAENLNYNIGINWCYGDNPSNCITYGRLYNWATIMYGEASSNTVPSGVQGICPDGWHLPSDEEWKILEGNTDTQYGVGDPEWDENGYRGYNAGKNFKTSTNWSSNMGTNTVGFSALPGGYRPTDGNFYELGASGYWWSSTDNGSTDAWFRILYYNHDRVYRDKYYKGYGFSVRCVRD